MGWPQMSEQERIVGDGACKVMWAMYEFGFYSEIRSHSLEDFE